MIRFVLAGLTAMVLLAGCDGGGSTVGPDPPEPTGPTPLELATPAGFPPLPIPADNPMTVEGVALGRRLFFDPILSGDNSIACASCHRPNAAFSDPRRVSLGVADREGFRNAPNLTNIGWANPRLFWDGRAESLEEQVPHPVVDFDEMDQDWGELLAELQNHAAYPALFEAAFETTQITQDLVTKALAQFERTFISAEAKFDRVQRGEATFTDAEARGFELFFTERGECFHCHGNPLFTDNDFHDIGLDAAPDDAGRSDVTGKRSDYGKFKSPTLRNVTVTAPYMHDGRFATLREAVQHYATGPRPSPNLDPLILVGGFGLSEQEVDDLLAFLETLTDPAFLNNPALRPPTVNGQ